MSDEQITRIEILKLIKFTLKMIRRRVIDIYNKVCNGKLI